MSEDKFLEGDKNYPKVIFLLDGRSFTLFVDDEYSDFQLNNPLLSLCLILRELEYFVETEDYLIWCKEKLIDPGKPDALNYYRSLSNIYNEIEKILGKIDSQISNYDFELNAGAARELRTST